MPEPTLRIELTASLTLGCYVVGIHLATLLALWCLGWPLLVDAALALALGTNAYRLHQRYARLEGAGAIRCFGCTSDDEWFVEQGSRRIAVVPTCHSVLHPCFVALDLRTRGGNKLRLPILPDMVEREAYRRLRLRLLAEH